MSTSKVLIGVLAGVAAGTLLGVLFAPEKGSNTRKKLTKRGEDYVDDMKEKFDDLLSNVTDKFGMAQEEVTHLANKGKAKVSEYKSQSNHNR